MLLWRCPVLISFFRRISCDCFFVWENSSLCRRDVMWHKSRYTVTSYKLQNSTFKIQNSIITIFGEKKKDVSLIISLYSVCSAFQYFTVNMLACNYNRMKSDMKHSLSTKFSTKILWNVIKQSQSSPHQHTHRLSLTFMYIIHTSSSTFNLQNYFRKNRTEPKNKQVTYIFRKIVSI